MQSDLAVFVQFGQQRGRRPLVGVSYSLHDGQVWGTQLRRTKQALRLILGCYILSTVQGSAVCRVTRTTLWTQGEELVTLAPCRDHLTPGPWSLQGRTCGYSLLYLCSKFCINSKVVLKHR